MTVEELKLEAAKLGYNITKKPEPVKLLPCVCGHNKRHLWFDCETQMHFYRCGYCGFDGYQSKTKKDAKTNWNKAIEEAMKLDIN